MPHITSIAYTPLNPPPSKGGARGGIATQSRPTASQRPPHRFARTPFQSAKLLPRHGIECDAKATRGRRQLNVMLAEQVAELAAEGFRTAPGQLGEQLVIAGLDPAAIHPGTQLRLGEAAVIELYELRTPCGRFAKVQNKPAATATARIGYMARVLTGGDITIGSPVEMVDRDVNSPGGRSSR